MSKSRSKRKFHYVYKIVELNTEMMYIGVRSCDIEPINDIGTYYYSSSTVQEFIDKQKVNPNNYLYEVILQFDSREEAEDYEIYIHALLNVSKDEKYYNRRNAGKNDFPPMPGFTTVKDKDGAFYKISVYDPRYLSGELVPLATGKVVVKDKDGNTLMVSNNDHRYLSGELVSFFKGKVIVKDHNGNNHMVNIDDKRISSGEFKYLTADTVIVKDKNNIYTRININDERIKFGNLIYSGYNRFVGVDSFGNRIITTCDDIRIKTGEILHHTKGTTLSRDAFNNYFMVPIDDNRLKTGELLYPGTGKISVTNGKENLLVDINDPRYLSGEYWFLHKDKIPVVDKNGKNYSVSRDDPRYLSGELVSMFKGMVTVRWKDKKKHKKCFNVTLDDPRYLSGELVQNTTGTMPVYNVKTGERTRLSKTDPRVLSGEYISTSKGRVRCYNMDGKLHNVMPTDERLVTGELFTSSDPKYAEVYKIREKAGLIKRKKKLKGPGTFYLIIKFFFKYSILYRHNI